ncbi:MAG: UDP-N-acetylmuramoyl-tripeptide--D-alanyl-D-alanine ligase [Sphingobacteriales bacterium]|nr:UDP-N-acetylmuramoyl-tripeptide--D-alanyl-D-alanine ligase [Sphingobacteriales bacterium]
MTTEQLYEVFKKHPSVQTDTRKLKAGDIFFALKGEHFNGNAFAKQAIDAGAAYAVIDENKYDIPGRTLSVENVLVTLQQLALYHRRRFSVPVIAITGSNGKTTTKELIHAVLATTFKTYTTEGNLNNHIGVPLTLLKVKADAEMIVVEMGANHQKEIASYCSYALPTHGLITNCGKAHLEGFGNVEGVKKGKGELFDHLRNHKGTAFVMWDYDYLREMSNGIPTIIKYGTADADVEGAVIANGPYLEMQIKKGADLRNIKTQLVGGYNSANVLAAVAVGKHFGVDDEKINSAIENYQPSNSRSQLIKKGNNTIIMDAYNANPGSMKLAIENFSKQNAAKKILLLGAMAELGKESLKEHEAIIDLIAKTKWNEVALVGGDFLKINHPYHKFENSIEAKEWMKRQNFENTHMLIKGSRSMQMEKVLD